MMKKLLKFTAIIAGFNLISIDCSCMDNNINNQVYIVEQHNNITITSANKPIQEIKNFNYNKKGNTLKQYIKCLVNHNESNVNYQKDYIEIRINKYMKFLQDKNFVDLSNAEKYITKCLEDIFDEKTQDNEQNNDQIQEKNNMSHDTFNQILNEEEISNDETYDYKKNNKQYYNIKQKANNIKRIKNNIMNNNK